MGNKCEHIELSTDDPDKAVAFYSKIFGWKIEATPMPGGEGVYHMFRNENGGGGIGGKMNPAQPTAWMPYITVKSIKATQEEAKALGGNPIPGFEYMALGEGNGAIGGFIDPTGAAIGLWEMGANAIAAQKAAEAAKKAAAKPAAKPAAKKAAKPAAKKAAKKAAKPAKKPAKKAAKKKR